MPLTIGLRALRVYKIILGEFSKFVKSFLPTARQDLMSVQYWTGLRAAVKAYILQVKMTRVVFLSKFSVSTY